MIVAWSLFGERVLIARRRLQLSQSQLAQAVGISRNYISMIERGIADPGYAIVITLCRYLALDPPQIINDDSDCELGNVAPNVAQPESDTPATAS